MHANKRVLVLATGTTALLLAAVMVIALTPTRSSAPTAVSATTLPPATIELQSPASRLGAPSAHEQDLVRTFRSTILSDLGVALIGAPNAVSAAPVGDADDFAIAGRLPAGSERVILLTSSHTHVLSWSDIDDVVAPDGSIVMTSNGWLLATFVSGELRLLVN